MENLDLTYVRKKEFEDLIDVNASSIWESEERMISKYSFIPHSSGVKDGLKPEHTRGLVSVNYLYVLTNKDLP